MPLTNGVVAIGETPAEQLASRLEQLAAKDRDAFAILVELLRACVTGFVDCSASPSFYPTND